LLGPFALTKLLNGIKSHDFEIDACLKVKTIGPVTLYPKTCAQTTTMRIKGCNLIQQELEIF
jgi:hypothetical protein